MQTAKFIFKKKQIVEKVGNNGPYKVMEITYSQYGEEKSKPIFLNVLAKNTEMAAVIAQLQPEDGIEVVRDESDRYNWVGIKIIPAAEVPTVNPKGDFKPGGGGGKGNYGPNDATVYLTAVGHAIKLLEVSKAKTIDLDTVHSLAVELANKAKLIVLSKKEGESAGASVEDKKAKDEALIAQLMGAGGEPTTTSHGTIVAGEPKILTSPLAQDVSDMFTE